MRKNLAIAFLAFALASGGSAYSTTRYYQYNGNVPFIEMMLNMMTVMGIIDKVPVDYMYGNDPGRYGFYQPDTFGPRPFFGAPYNRYSAFNGLWVARNGEMLGIKDQRFLWDDGNRRYLSGTLRFKNGVMVASIKGLNRRIAYRYTLRNNELITKDQNGVVRVFRRVRTGRSFQ